MVPVRVEADRVAAQRPQTVARVEVGCREPGGRQRALPRVQQTGAPVVGHPEAVAERVANGSILVNWSNYKYNLADVVMVEDDDGTNYRAPAQAITTALLTVTDQGAYIPRAG